MARRTSYDPWLFFTASLLVIGGLMMVGSSSTYVAMEYGKEPSAYYWKQALHALLGFGALLLAVSIPYQRLQRRWLIMALITVSTVALVGVLAMPAAGGAHRWYMTGPFRLQPSEFARLFVVLFMAYMLARKEHRVNELWSVPVPCLTVVGTLALLVLIEPDLGSAVMLIGVAGVMIFVAGLHWKYIGLTAAGGSVAFAIAVIIEPYRIKRIVDYFRSIFGTVEPPFQVQQALIAFGNGGVTGVGLGQGRQKAFFVPASHTDFIYSIIGEELGLIGTLTLLIAFVLLYWRGVRTALRAPDRFGFYLALGVTSLVVLQALVNMGVCLGLLPTKGLPLPMISYGGSSLLASMAAVGLLLNVSQHSN